MYDATIPETLYKGLVIISVVQDLRPGESAEKSKQNNCLISLVKEDDSI